MKSMITSVKKSVIFLAVISFLGTALNASALDKNGNFESIKEQDEFIAKTLKNMANEINSQTPIQIDEETVVMFVVSLQKTITFNLRLPQVRFSDIEPNSLAQIARENLNHTVCQNEATQQLIDLGVEYVYLYSDSDGKQITRVSINNYHC
jgi:hypothetical protein